MVGGGKYFFRYRLKGFVLSMVNSCLNYSSRFPDGGAKRGIPTMMTSMVTARRPSTSAKVNKNGKITSTS